MAEALNKKNLRVAIIDPVGQKAGMDHYDISLARAMNKKGCLVNIYSNFIDNEGFAVKKFDFSFNKNIFRFFKLIINYLSSLIVAKGKGTEVLILHNFHSSRIDYLLTRLTKIFGFNVCVIIHDVESLISQDKKSWLKKIILVSNYIIVHNETAYDEIIEKVKDVDIGKIKIIPHGNYLELPVNIQRGKALKNFSLNENNRYILFFGMIKKSKGLEVLIEAMKDVQKDIHLIIAGRTRDAAFSEYQAIIRNLGLEERIHSFIRFITNDERNILFNIAELAVLPYHRIYQSGVMLLAMSYGIPVITSELPSNRVSELENYMLFKPGNSSDLAAKINSLMNDEERRISISKSSKEYVKIHHSWENIADLFIRTLN